MKKITFRCFFVFLMVALPSMAFADLIDLAPSMGSQWSAGTGASRGIIFNANDDFSLNSVGIELNLSGTQTLTASLYAISGIATVGAQLASNSSQFADIGRSWFDIPLSYAFDGNGNRYLLEISFGGVAQEAVFYGFQGYPSGTTNPPYTVGPISIFDGTLVKLPRIGNLAHFRMDIGTPPPPYDSGRYNTCYLCKPSKFNVGSRAFHYPSSLLGNDRARRVQEKISEVNPNTARTQLPKITPALPSPIKGEGRFHLSAAFLLNFFRPTPRQKSEGGPIQNVPR